MRDDLCRRSLIVSAAAALAAPAFAADPAALRGDAGGRAAALACSPDGRIVAVGGQDGEVRLWDMATATPANAVRVSDDSVFGLAWDAAGRRLVAGCGDGGLIVLDGRSLEVRRRIAVAPPVLFAAFLPFGEIVAADLGGGLSVWDPETGDRRRGWDVSSLLAAALMPDGASILVSNPGRRISLSDGSVLGRLTGGGETHAMAVSHDGHVIAATQWTGELRIWRDGNETPLVVKPRIATYVAGPRNAMPAEIPMPMLGLALTADGRVAAAASTDRRIRFFNTETGALLATSARQPGMVGFMAYSPDETRLCTADFRGGIGIHTVRNGCLPDAPPA